MLEFFLESSVCIYLIKSFDSQNMFSLESSKLLEIILNVQENKLSDLVIVFALSNLLLIPKKVPLLIEQGGLEVLRNILSNSKNKVKINYYGLLCYWILSYEPEFVQYASSPNVFLIRPNSSLSLHQWLKKQVEKK